MNKINSFFTIVSLTLFSVIFAPKESKALMAHCIDSSNYEVCENDPICLRLKPTVNQSCITDFSTVDLDGDKLKDAVYIYETGDDLYSDRVYSISWNKNMGNGNFSPRQVIRSIERKTFFKGKEERGASFPEQRANLVLKDLDSDGLIDIVFSLGKAGYDVATGNTYPGYNELFWYKNKGGMSFSRKKPLITHNTTGVIVSTFLEDVNEDGILDFGYSVLIKAGWVDNVENYIIIGKGGGRFSSEPILLILEGVEYTTFGLAIGQFTEEGAKSAIFLSSLFGSFRDGSRAYLLGLNLSYVLGGHATPPEDRDEYAKNNTRNKFYHFDTKIHLKTEIDKAIVTDLNNDGIDELFLSLNGIYGGTYLYTFSGNEFVFSKEELTDEYTTAVMIKDVDGDSLLDIVYSTHRFRNWFNKPRYLAWKKNQGNGKFSSEKIIKKLPAASVLGAVEDLDGDGLADFILLSKVDGQTTFTHLPNSILSSGQEEDAH